MASSEATMNDDGGFIGAVSRSGSGAELDPVILRRVLAKLRGVHVLTCIVHLF